MCSKKSKSSKLRKTQNVPAEHRPCPYYGICPIVIVGPQGVGKCSYINEQIENTEK